MGLIIDGVPVQDLVLDGQSVPLYIGGNPPVKVWPTRETVQITLGAGSEARDQFRAALAARGLDYTTVTELPFDIELVGSGNAQLLFYGCSALTSIPPLDTSQVTNMNGMFQMCSSLVTVPPLDTSNVWNAPSMFAYCSSLTSVPTMDATNMTNVSYMFTGCRALTDGNVLLTSRNPAVTTTGMINNSGLTREPFYTADGQPWPIEVHEVTLTDVTGNGTSHPLLTVAVPAGETWSVRIQGTVTKAQSNNARQPIFRIGAADSGKYGPGAAVDFSGTVTASNSTIAMVTGAAYSSGTASFTGTVTIEKYVYDSDSNPVGPRTVTISKNHVGQWAQGTVTGDTSLIQEWVGKQHVIFVVDVTCDQALYSSDSYVTQDPGTVLRAGAEIRPHTSDVYTFTEVL